MGRLRRRAAAALEGVRGRWPAPPAVRADPPRVRLMAVTKTVPLAEVEAACAAGLRLFGENRVQEAEDKYGAGGRGRRGGWPLHLIGHLQRNKARMAAQLFTAWNPSTRWKPRWRWRGPAGRRGGGWRSCWR